MSNDTQVALFGAKTELPAHLANAGSMGNENVSTSDLQIPRLNVLQALSPQVEELDGAKAGLIHNSITDELYEELYVVNVYYDKEYTIFKKRDLGTEFLGNHPTMEAAQAHLTSERPGRESDYNIIETGRHALIALDMQGNKVGPAELLCSGSKMFFSKRWNTDIATRCSDKPRFAAVWKLSPVKQKNDKGSWYNLKADFVNWCPEDLANEAQDLYLAIKAKAQAA